MVYEVEFDENSTNFPDIFLIPQIFKIICSDMNLCVIVCYKQATK